MKRNFCLFFFLFLMACAVQPVSEKPRSVVPAATQAIPKELVHDWNDPEKLFLKGTESEERRDFKTAIAAFQRIRDAFPKTDFATRVGPKIIYLERRQGATLFKIGVVLPLSERHGHFGQATLNGISCAFGLFDPCDKPNVDVQLVVRDATDSPAMTESIVRELIEKEQVVALIGPLLSATTLGAARIAEASQIPILLLSPKERTVLGQEYVFQHTLLPETEVAFLMDQALAMGINHFLLLSPKDQYGQYYRQLFLDTLALKKKGVVVDELKYAPDLPEFSGILARFLERGKVQRALHDHPKSTAIFLPDSYRRIVYLADGLDRLHIQNLTMIGTSRWYHPELIKKPHPSLEGALLTTPFLPQSQKEGAKRFTKMFGQAFGNEPAWLEAVGYDAGRLILAALESTKNRSPKELQQALKSLHNFPGAVGQLNWSDDRVSKWPLELLTIRNGQFVLAK